jgi:hypothetical protein
MPYLKNKKETARILLWHLTALPSAALRAEDRVSTMQAVLSQSSCNKNAPHTPSRQ